MAESTISSDPFEEIAAVGIQHTSAEDQKLARFSGNTGRRRAVLAQREMEK